jgi:hypothetical protein
MRTLITDAVGLPVHGGHPVNDVCLRRQIPNPFRHDSFRCASAPMLAQIFGISITSSQSI